MASTHSDIGAPAAVSIDGLQVPECIAPSSPEEVAALLADAASAGKAVAPVGGGTKLALGNVPDRVDLALSTRGLDRVLHYEPTDLTLSVEAGLGFSEVQALLAERGQTLPVEIADAERATIGGMIATALAGPRRFGSGTLRDLLIGITVAYPSGIVAKAGGLVVKNVSGFDLMRLHLGALGTLGVIVSANFKTLPLPRDEATILLDPAPLRSALASAAAARWDRARPVAIEVVREPEGWRAAIRVEGRPGTVARATAELQGKIGGQVLPTEMSRSWWRGRVQAESLHRADGSVLLRCGGAPAGSAALAESVTALLLRRDISPEFLAVSPGLGACTLRIAAREPSIDLCALQLELLAIAETVTVLAAPADMKAGIDVWGRVPETVSVMRALKAEFDPARTLNPGRYIDRI